MIDERFLRSTFTALVKRLSCFNRDFKNQEWSWNFFACQNNQNELGNFLDAINDQELLNRIKKLDSSPTIDITFFDLTKDK